MYIYVTEKKIVLNVEVLVEEQFASELDHCPHPSQRQNHSVSFLLILLRALPSTVSCIINK